MFGAASYSLDETISSFLFTTATVGNGSKVSVGLDPTEAGSSGRWTERATNLYGKCYSLEVAHSTAQLGITRIEIRSR